MASAGCARVYVNFSDKNWLRSRKSMDEFTFISEIIKALAWPGAIIILACLLRKPLVGLVPLMRKLKYKELELEFSQEVLALKTESPVLYSPQKEDLSATTSKALDLVSLSTRAAIMEAWIDVETAAAEVASSFWSQSSSEAMRNFPNLGEYLHQCKVIDDKQLEIYRKLRRLRNKAAHAEEMNLSEEDATSYVIMAFNLARHIKSN